MEYYNYEDGVSKEDIRKYDYLDAKYAVVIHIIDEEGNILLQQRGIKSRDENGLYEDVSGKVEEYDIDYKCAIIREIKEEMGEEVNIIDISSVGIFHCKKDIDWLFIVFKGKYKDGNIKIMEPEKCMGYKFFSYEEALSSDELSESCKFLTKSLRKNNIL